MKVIVGIGVPGSGKTTVLKKIAHREDILYVCPDDIRQELTGDSSCQSANKLVWEEAYRRIAEALLIGDSVVLDATNARRDGRIKLTQHCMSYSDRAKIYGVWLRTPLQVCLKRNAQRKRVVPEEVIFRMFNWLQKEPPTCREGFTDIMEVEG